MTPNVTLEISDGDDISMSMQDIALRRIAARRADSIENNGIGPTKTLDEVLENHKQRLEAIKCVFAK
jgi:hypothetical protein